MNLANPANPINIAMMQPLASSRSCRQEVQAALEEVKHPVVCKETAIVVEREYVKVPVHEWQSIDYVLFTVGLVAAFFFGFFFPREE